MIRDNPLDYEYVFTCIYKFLTMYLSTRSCILAPQHLTLCARQVVYLFSQYSILRCVPDRPNRCHCNRLWALRPSIDRQDLLTHLLNREFTLPVPSNSAAPLRVGAHVFRGPCWGLTRLARPALRTPGVGRRVGRPLHPCALSYIFMCSGFSSRCGVTAMFL